MRMLFGIASRTRISRVCASPLKVVSLLACGLCATVCPALSAPAVTAQDPQDAARTPVWFVPHGDAKYTAVRQLFEHPEQWAGARQGLGGIGYYGNNLGDSFTDDELAQIFRNMREWKLQLGFEVPAIKEWGPTADITVGSQMPALLRYERLGGQIDSFFLDGPYSGARHSLKRDTAYAVEQTARVI